MMHASALKNSLLLALLGMLNTVVIAEPLDKTAIKTIALRMDVQALDDLGVSASPLQEKVIHNLNEWCFPIVTGTVTATHSLEVSIGKIENSSTPVGFSFSSGNSDPRSLAFQRDDVLPVTCRLVAQKYPAQHAELTMSFSAEKPVKAEKLADHISTVCFDLLDDLHFLVPETTKTLKTPAWMPTVKVETLSEAQPKVNSTTEPIVQEEWRKQLIIQNQGSPLILKMGHDR